MPLLSVNAADGDVVMPDGSGCARPLRAALQALPARHPVILMVHGYRYAPSLAQRSPHDRILSPGTGDRPCRSVAWPRQIGCVTPDGDDLGLAIGFGWEACGTIWQAYAAAERAGKALARLLARIRAQHDGPVGLLAHSMGARVALAALAASDAPLVDRMVFLAAAEFHDAAARSRATPAGRATEIVNITSDANALFDFLLGRLFLRRPGTTLGHRGLDDARWCDVALDDPGALAALRGMGYRIAAPSSRICHRNLYLRAGAFDFYRDLLRDRQTLPLSLLGDTLPVMPVRRRIRGRAPQAAMGLPSAENASP